MRQLEAEGYACMRSAGSHGTFDVVAIRHDGVRLIQVKKQRRPGPAEREAIALFRTPPNCTKEIWVYKARRVLPEGEVVG